MGWGYSGKCFDTVDLAKTDYITNFQSFSTYDVNYLVKVWKVNLAVTPTVTAQGKLFYQLRGESTATTGTGTNQYYQFDSCTVAATTSYDYTAAAAMFNFAFIGVFSLWYLAKNIGYIKRAVKWF